MRFLLVDFGSSSCRARVQTEEGRILAEVRIPVHVRYGSDRAEIDPEEALALVISAIREVLGRAGNPKLDGLGLSSMLAWVFLDRKLRPLGPGTTWADCRSTAEVHELATILGVPEFSRRCGRRLSAELLLPMLRWLSRNEESRHRGMAKVLSLKDYFLLRLTGKFLSDWATASCTGIVGLESRAVEEDLAALAGIRGDAFPNPVSAATIAGPCRGPAARSAGLPEELPCVVGAVDGTTAMYGSGVLLPGRATLVSGTTDVVMMSSEARPREFRAELSVYPSMTEKGYLVGGATGFSCGALDRFAALMSVDIGKAEAALAALPLDLDAPIAFPGFTGERSPYWMPEARGGILGLRVEHGPYHVLRACMESSCFRIAALIEALEAAGLRPENIVVSGGGASSPSWNRLRADTTGLAVSRLAAAEATMAGAALFLESALTGRDLPSLSQVRALAAETVRPDVSASEFYRGRRAKFENVLGFLNGTQRKE